MNLKLNRIMDQIGMLMAQLLDEIIKAFCDVCLCSDSYDHKP